MIAKIIACIITAAGFGYGINRLMKKGVPMYFRLLLAAIGCYMLKELSLVVDSLCNGSQAHSDISMLANLGCFLFLLSANYGQLDSVVDGGEAQNRKAARLAVIAPLILAVGSVYAGILVVLFKPVYLSAMIVIILLTALPASYYNLKHILMPIDDFGFLKGTKWCNIFALLIYAANICYVLAYYGGYRSFKDIISIVMAVLVAGLSISAVRGRERWRA